MIKAESGEIFVRWYYRLIYREMAPLEMEKRSVRGEAPESGDGAGNGPKRKGVFLWILAGVVLCGWMFFLGILVGRGTAPIQFDTQSLQKDLLALKNAAIEKTFRQYQKDAKSADEQKGVVFYDVLKRKTDGPDPQWGPRPPKQPAPQLSQSQRLPEPSPVHSPTGSQPAPALPGAPEYPGAGGTSKMTAAAPKPGADVKDLNSVPPVKVKSENFKKPVNLKSKETVTSIEKNLVASSAPPAPPPVTTATPAPMTSSVNTPAVSPNPSQPPSSSSGNWTIQVAAMKDTAEADRIVAKLKQQGYPAVRLTGEVVGKGVWHRIRIGPYPRREEADAVVGKLSKEGLSPIAINSGSN